ncbi:sequestosome-1 [Anaeramoeba flamelloides]|uniref:Sequestosome-1 n=1 Tax=Anaeramoeba flamelloides TaxID=1746091 RepID=A0ABQ8Y7Y9_9EUKA|nr:sequestosome-1 [Anaeramoeba flamelloides]
MTEEMNKLNLKNQISIKIFYQEECRRFSVSEKIDYNELCTIVGDTLSIEFKQDQHFLSYQDEEDELIIFSTDLELSEAFKFAQTFNRSILRLFVSIYENKKHKRYEQKENKKQKRFEQKENEKQERIEQKEENDDSSESLSFSDEEKLMIPYLPRKLYKELQNFLLQIQDDLDKFLNNSLFIEWLKSHFLQILQEYQQIYENGEIQTKLFSNSLKKFLENIEIEPETKDKIEQLFLLIAQKMIKIKQDEQKFPFEMIFKTMSETPFPDLLTTIRESSKNKFQRKVHKRKCKHEKRKKKYQKFKSKKKDNHNFTKKKIIQKYKNKKDEKKQPQLYKHSKYNRSYKSKKKYDPNNDKFNKKKLQKYRKKYNTRRGRKFERKNPNSFKPNRKADYSNMNKVRNDHDHNFLDTKQNLKLKNNFKQEIKQQIRIERKQWKHHKKQFRKQKMDFKKQLRKQRNKIKKENKQFPDKRKYNTKHYRKNNSKHYRKKFNKKKIPKNVIYQEELTVLENIGFINHDLNLKLLSIYNGDTKQTIQALLNKLY